MYVLENDFVRLVISELGLLSELVNKSTGHNYAGGGGFWRMYFQRDELMDREIIGSECTPLIKYDGDSIELLYASVRYLDDELAVKVCIKVFLVGDETRWTIDITNNQEGITLREAQFPLVRGLKLDTDQKLLWSKSGGQILNDVRSDIKKQFSGYKASDHNFLQLELHYPYPAATNCYTFTSKKQGLYCGCHNDSFEFTNQLFRLYKDDLECGFARYPNLEKGGSCSLGEFVIAPYRGDWHIAADKYRKWANNWFTHAQVPQWVQKLKGWQRIIMKHQYGEVHYDYSQIAEIHRDGLEAGIDSLHMFGWWKGGMDNGNPDYIIDDGLGGAKMLKDEITGFQTNGSVILYSNGRLIDLDTDYYKTVGKRISVKDRFGAEIRDAYRFKANGTFNGNFGNRTFTAACPCCEEWFDKLKEVVDTAIDLGCKAVFFDQLGGGEFPCYDQNHGHETPFMKMSWQKAQLTRRLREYMISRAPGMAIGIELLSDVSAQYCDFIHSCPGHTEAVNDWESTGQKPQLLYFIDWFRYCFPEIILTDREIRDDTDIERRVNHALMHGLRSDVEIYRCRKTIVETPHYCAYLKQANQLREKYSEFLLEGRYVDTVGIAIDNSEVEARGFVNGEKLAVVLSQSHLESTELKLTVAEGSFIEAGGLGAFTIDATGSNANIKLGKHALAVVVFDRS